MCSVSGLVLLYFSSRRFAKMWFKGISFSSKNCPLVYLVDAAGVRSTVDRFPEILEENASEVFYGYVSQSIFKSFCLDLEKKKCTTKVFYNISCSNSRYGYDCADEAMKLLANSATTNADGSMEINDIRISHSTDGVIS